jgi:hypothetical protein
MFPFLTLRMAALHSLLLPVELQRKGLANHNGAARCRKVDEDARKFVEN